MKNKLNNTPIGYVGHILKRAAQLWPERTALICADTSITYAQLEKQATHLSNTLLSHKLKPRDKVIIIWENSVEFFVAYHAAWQLGAVVVPLNIFLHEKELEHIINDSQPHIIIASTPQQKKLGNINVKLPLLLGEDVLEKTKSTDTPQNIAYHALDENELCALLYTSGTTGLAKGVMLSSKNIITNVMQALELFDTESDERVYGALPLFHSYMQNTCVWSSCIAGTTVILVPKIDRTSLKKALDQKPTIVLGIPTLFGLFCMMRGIHFDSVKLFVSGGDALPDKIRMGFALLFNRKICNGYGLTEAAPFVAVDLDDEINPTSTIGKPMAGIQVEIRNEEESPLTKGSIGTLWIKGDNVMLGYYNAPDATNAILKNGWLNTGDLAYINENNKIIIAGREKDLIVNKGIKIYPQEVENILMGHTLVTAVAVIGIVQDNEEVPIAVVAAKSNTHTLEQELLDLCKNNLASYKVPRIIYVRKELPTTATGKVDKKTLRAEFTKK